MHARKSAFWTQNRLNFGGRLNGYIEKNVIKVITFESSVVRAPLQESIIPRLNLR